MSILALELDSVFRLAGVVGLLVDEFAASPSPPAVTTQSAGVELMLRHLLGQSLRTCSDELHG